MVLLLLGLTAGWSARACRIGFIILNRLHHLSVFFQIFKEQNMIAVDLHFIHRPMKFIAQFS